MNVLLIEDSEADARLITRILGKSVLRTAVDVASDGVEALELLRDGTSRRPDIIVLDLNMPRMNGFETLEALKGDEALSSIPVIVLTSTRDAESVDRSYRLHASAFVTKPAGLDGYRQVLQAFEDFWLRQARLPDAEPRRP